MPDVLLCRGNAGSEVWLNQLLLLRQKHAQMEVKLQWFHCRIHDKSLGKANKKGFFGSVPLSVLRTSCCPHLFFLISFKVCFSFYHHGLFESTSSLWFKYLLIYKLNTHSQMKLWWVTALSKFIYSRIGQIYLWKNVLYKDVVISCQKKNLACQHVTLNHV